MCELHQYYIFSQIDRASPHAPHHAQKHPLLSFVENLLNLNLFLNYLNRSQMSLIHLARTLRFPDYAPALCGRPNACFDVVKRILVPVSLNSHRRSPHVIATVRPPPHHTNRLKLGNNAGRGRGPFWDSLEKDLNSIDFC